MQDGHVTVANSRFEYNGVWGITYVCARRGTAKTLIIAAPPTACC
jgi:hypothetical protein